jgi:hypothetical protein
MCSAVPRTKRTFGQTDAETVSNGLKRGTSPLAKHERRGLENLSVLVRSIAQNGMIDIVDRRQDLVRVRLPRGPTRWTEHLRKGVDRRRLLDRGFQEPTQGIGFRLRRRRRLGRGRIRRGHFGLGATKRDGHVRCHCDHSNCSSHDGGCSLTHGEDPMRGKSRCHPIRPVEHTRNENNRTSTLQNATTRTTSESGDVARERLDESMLRGILEPASVGVAGDLWAWSPWEEAEG